MNWGVGILPEKKAYTIERFGKYVKEFCMELVYLKKKEDKISLLCKLITKMIRDAADDNVGIL